MCSHSTDFVPFRLRCNVAWFIVELHLHVTPCRRFRHGDLLLFLVGIHTCDFSALQLLLSDEVTHSFLLRFVEFPVVLRGLRVVLLTRRHLVVVLPHPSYPITHCLWICLHPGWAVILLVHRFHHFTLDAVRFWTTPPEIEIIFAQKPQKLVLDCAPGHDHLACFFEV